MPKFNKSFKKQTGIDPLLVLKKFQKVLRKKGEPQTPSVFMKQVGKKFNKKEIIATLYLLAKSIDSEK